MFFRLLQNENVSPRSDLEFAKALHVRPHCAMACCYMLSATHSILSVSAVWDVFFFAFTEILFLYTEKEFYNFEGIAKGNLKNCSF